MKTQKTQHGETPEVKPGYFVHEFTTTDRYYPVVNAIGKCLARFETLDNANKYVAMLGSHDALVAACEAALTVLSLASLHVDPTTGEATSPVAIKLRAALALTRAGAANGNKG